MVVTLSQQYNIGEKPNLILYTYINRHAGTPEKKRKQKQCSISSNMVVIVYCYIIGCEDEVITWHYNTQLIEVVNTYDLGVVSHIQRIGCQTEKNVYLPLTDPLQIRPWSQDRRNQTKSNRKYGRRQAGKADRREWTKK